MKVDVWVGQWIPAVDSSRRLAGVGGGADIVDGYVVGGDEAGEVEELVEMALSWKRHHDNHHLCFHGLKLPLVKTYNVCNIIL